MGQEKVLLKSEERKSLSEAAGFLRQLADKVESGTVTLMQADTELSFDLPGMITLEIKVEEEDKKGRTKFDIEVEIEWYEGDEAGEVKLA
jgi:amphi-Trp domain-containing protein